MIALLRSFGRETSDSFPPSYHQSLDSNWTLRRRLAPTVQPGGCVVTLGGLPDGDGEDERFYALSVGTRFVTISLY